MYIHRSVLLLFIFIYLLVLIGLDWVRTGPTEWYRPFLVALCIIAVSAWLQRHQGNDDY